MHGLPTIAPDMDPGITPVDDTATWMPDVAMPKRSQLVEIVPFILFGGDVVAFLLAVLAAMGLANFCHEFVAAGTPGVGLGTVFGNAAPIGACMLTYFALAGVYRSRRPFWSEFGRVISVSIFALLATGLYACILRLDGLRIAVFAPWVLFPFLAEFVRQCCRRILHRFDLWQVPTIFIGSAPDEDIAQSVIDSETLSSFRIVGRHTPEQAVHALDGIVSQSPYAGLQLLLCIDAGCQSGIALVEHLTRRRIPFVLIPRMADLPAHSFSHASYFSHDTIMLSYRSNLEDPMLQAVKRAFDLVVAMTVLLIASPVFVLLYGLIAIDGGQPVYGHRRIGLGGREFACLKFRSMARNGDEILTRLLASDAAMAAEWEQTRKLVNDPRITRIGHFIRKTSLDELPQLLNVLRGDMSLVGPRPIVEAEIRHYGLDIDHYHGTRPGITGLWQVSGRSDTGYMRRVQLDRWYVRNWTLWHDVAILAKTIPAVLRQRGAR